MNNEIRIDGNKITLLNVPSAYHNIFTRPIFKGELCAFGVNFLLDKKTQSHKIEEIKEEIKKVVNKDKQFIIKSPHYFTLKDKGAFMSLRAANYNNFDIIVDNYTKTYLDVTDEKPFYEGCHVDAEILPYYTYIYIPGELLHLNY